MHPVIVDIYAAAHHSGIRPGTLRQRLRRGALTHHGHDTAGRALVDFRELPDRAVIGWARVTDGDPCWFCPCSGHDP